MDLKRAVSISVATYIVSLIIGMIVMILMGFNPSDTNTVPNNILYANIIVSIIVAGLFTLWYFGFKKQIVKPSVKSGFLFGVLLIIVGFILDLIVFGISALFTDAQVNVVDYYSNPIFWIALALFVIVPTLIGWLKGLKK